MKYIISGKVKNLYLQNDEQTHQRVCTVVLQTDSMLQMSLFKHQNCSPNQDTKTTLPKGFGISFHGVDLFVVVIGGLALI